MALLAGTPLTASFSNVPDEHTGADFTFDLAFTDELAAGWKKIKAAFRVSGGSINRVWRKTKGSDLAWNVKVRPAGTDSLTIVRHEGAEGRPRWPPSCSHAARGMRAGPSEPPGRGRLQTAVRCLGQEPRW